MGKSKFNRRNKQTTPASTATVAPSTSERTQIIVKMKLDEFDYQKTTRKPSPVDDEIFLDKLVCTSTTNPPGKDSSREKTGAAIVDDNDSEKEWDFDEGTVLSAKVLVTSSRNWFIQRPLEAASGQWSVDDEKTEKQARTLAKLETEYRMIKYEDLERLFLFGLDVVSKATHRTPMPLYHQPKRIPEAIYFSSYAIVLKEDFEINFYFVNLLTAQAVTQQVFRNTVSMFKNKFGNLCFLPNRLIAVTTKLDVSETEPLKVALAGQGDLATIQFIDVGSMRHGPLSLCCTDVLHFLVLDWLRKANICRYGTRYFVWDEEPVRDPQETHRNFASLGTGMRLTVGNQNGQPMLNLEPFAYLKDNRGLLDKLRRARDANADYNDQVRGKCVISRYDFQSHRIKAIEDQYCPMFASVPNERNCSTLLDHLDCKRIRIQYPFQPLLSTQYFNEMTKEVNEFMVVPELCQEFKPLMITRRHFRTKSVIDILGSEEDWQEKMKTFVGLIQTCLTETMNSWKVSIELERVDGINLLPKCGVEDTSNWFSD